MMRLQVAAFLIGKLLLAFACFMLLPLGYAIIQGEEGWWAFFLSACITGLIGYALVYYGEREGHIGLREGFLVVAGSWLTTCFLGSLPFWLSGAVPGFIDALFESVSGLTATGASVINDLETLPRSILLWRSLTHWVGGMGIIVLFVVFLKNLGAEAVNLFKAEVPGPKVERVMPRISSLAFTLWKMYIFFTALLLALLYLAGMDFFEAVNHTFSTIAAGGFSTKNASIQHFDNLVVEMIITFFMVLAGGNYALYYVAWKKGPGKLVQDAEFLLYLTIIAVATAGIAGALHFQGGVALADGLQEALFTVVSMQTSTGFVVVDYDQWPPVTKMILLALMFIGGCAGSTAGGIKVIRWLILVKYSVSTVQRSIHPGMVQSIKINKKPMEPTVLTTTLQFFFLYMMIYIVSVVIVAATGMPAFDSFGAVASSMGNIGPAFGVVGPTTTFADAHPVAKFVFMANMLLGRLELLTLLVLIHPEFWQPYLIRRQRERISA